MLLQTNMNICFSFYRSFALYSTVFKTIRMIKIHHFAKSYYEVPFPSISSINQIAHHDFQKMFESQTWICRMELDSYVYPYITYPHSSQLKMLCSNGLTNVPIPFSRLYFPSTQRL